MLSEARVGEITGADGTVNPLRASRLGALVSTDGHARYQEPGLRGRMFVAANQAAQAISVALATAYTGLLLYNPIGSGVILIPNKVKFALSVAPAAIATIGLISGFQSAAGPTGTTPVVARSSIIGNTKTPVGQVFSVATITTPVWHAHLLDGFTAAALPAPNVPIDLEGIFQIYPGGFLGIGALTAVTGLGSISWEEVVP
jgi:hypothetical protein